MAALHIDCVREVEIDEETDIVKIKAKSEGDAVCWKIPIRVFERGLALANRAMSQRTAKAKVVPLRRH